MERVAALERLTALVGEDLIPLAQKHAVTVFTLDQHRKNKGWAGHTIERYLGLPLNSSQSPNFGSWELKVIPLKLDKYGVQLRVKETMAITMIDAVDVAAKPFSESHLYAKLRKMVLVARVFEDQKETRSIVHAVSSFDLDDNDTLRVVQSDYELVRTAIIKAGFESLSGRMGQLVQPRTKGPGHGSTSRAFYARKALVASILNAGVSLGQQVRP